VARPRTGDKAAAIVFCRLQSRVKEAGSTAEDTITPIRRYRYPSDIPITATVSSLMRLLFERRMVAVQLHTDVIQPYRKSSHYNSKCNDTAMSHIDESPAAGLGVKVCLVDVVCEDGRSAFRTSQLMVLKSLLHEGYMRDTYTAISSAEDAEVTAMKTSSSVHAAPPLPSRATAALGNTKPALTSAADNLSGYVGNEGCVSLARAARPIVVAQSQG